MSHWSAVAYWVGINIVVGVFGPLILEFCLLGTRFLPLNTTHERGLS
jgi:hypothetical protein